MSYPTTGKLIASAVLCCVASVVYAKLPPASEEAKAKAAAAKVKAGEAAKKQHEALTKAQDRAVENYKRKHEDTVTPTDKAKAASMKHGKKKK